MNVKQQVELPKNPLPIVIIGAGGIVKDAHLPAYRLANFKVRGIYDKIREKAETLQNAFDNVEKVYSTLDELIADAQQLGAVYDLALPAVFHAKVLEKLPNESAVLIQKPMGET